jgi:hypothetical protein
LSIKFIFKDMRGSLLVNFDELINDIGIDYISVSVNNSVRKIQNTDINNLYSTYLNTGDTVTVSIVGDFTYDSIKYISVYRRDFTTDDQGGDFGIRDTFITSGTTTGITFTAVTVSDAYNFHYVVDLITDECGAPSLNSISYNASTPSYYQLNLSNWVLTGIRSCGSVSVEYSNDNSNWLSPTAGNPSFSCGNSTATIYDSTLTLTGSTVYFRVVQNCTNGGYEYSNVQSILIPQCIISGGTASNVTATPVNLQMRYIGSFLGPATGNFIASTMDVWFSGLTGISTATYNFPSYNFSSDFTGTSVNQVLDTCYYGTPVTVTTSRSLRKVQNISTQNWFSACSLFINGVLASSGPSILPAGPTFGGGTVYQEVTFSNSFTINPGDQVQVRWVDGFRRP